jgi:hypothetical protein
VRVDNNQKKGGIFMKKAMLIIVASLLLTATCWAEMQKEGSMMENPIDEKSIKGQEVTITGHMSCTYCKLAGGMTHQCTPECCQACVKAGDSVLLQDGKENLYILLNKEKEKPLITPDRLPLVGGEVTVKGIMVKTGGLQGIYVEKMEKAPEKMMEKAPMSK